MMALTLTSSLILTLSNILMFNSSTLSKKNFKDREKNSPFECGFDPKSPAGLPFSLQFFLIAVIFHIFDIEIMLGPLISIMKASSIKSFIMISSFFMLILLLGLYHEWAF